MPSDFREINLDDLSISPQNVRKDPGDLTELMDSITEMGVLEPILVRPVGEGYEVIAGYRRTEAARRAGLTTIPASVLELTEVQAIVISLIENIQRKDLTLVERVETYQQLEALEPAYRKKAALAKVVGGSPQKIGQELQAYEIAVALQPHGIRVESHFHRTSLSCSIRRVSGSEPRTSSPTMTLLISRLSGHDGLPPIPKKRLRKFLRT